MGVPPRELGRRARGRAVHRAGGVGGAGTAMGGGGRGIWVPYPRHTQVVFGTFVRRSH
jgi:hypothetical protein